jgi:hypothetical protein
VFTGDHASAPIPASAPVPGQAAQESAGAGEAGEGPRPAEDHGVCAWLGSAGNAAGAADLWVFAIVGMLSFVYQSHIHDVGGGG